MTSEKRAIAKWPSIMIELSLLHTVYIATYSVDRVLSVDQFTIFQFKNCVIDIRPILSFFSPITFTIISFYLFSLWLLTVAPCNAFFPIFPK